MLLSVSVMNSGVKLFNWLAVPNYLNYITQGSIIKYQKHSTWNDKYMSIHIFTTKQRPSIECAFLILNLHKKLILQYKADSITSACSMPKEAIFSVQLTDSLKQVHEFLIL